MSEFKKPKTIAILTSGGDAPGMNAAIRAVARCAFSYGMEVYGINKGYRGLLDGEFIKLTSRDVSEIIQKGGTVFQTARCKEFETPEGIKRGAEMIKLFGVDVLVVIGGDGSFKGARELSNVGVPVIGIPGTIDNDIGCSDYTLGYDTAMNTAMEAIDKIRDTATSHRRCNIIEVMGREAGYIALNVGVACGAEAVLIPEEDVQFDDVVRQIIDAKNRGKKHFIVVVAEGVGRCDELAKLIEDKTNIQTRATILGYMQRGGSPSLRDRVMASRMGYHAVELINEGVGNRVVVTQLGSVTDIDINEALEMKKGIDKRTVDMARRLSR